MTLDRDDARKPKMLSVLDLEQIKDAVREVRASSPKSVLADLVEEKVQALEDVYAAPRPGFSHAASLR